jgi:superfamily I DNA/RNA helicase
MLKKRSARDGQRGGKPAIRKIAIQSTTVQSSKGLAEDYVFITHFDDQYFLRNKGKIGDRDICNFLVALTRARQKVFLISSQKKYPTFLKWIAADRLDAGLEDQAE